MPLGILLATAEGGQDGSTAAGAVPVWGWLALFAVIAVLLFVDLELVMREPHEVGTREAAWHSAAWIAIGLAFTGVIWWSMGGTAAQEYITGYLIETGLSIDNVFVWAGLFTFFAVPYKYQHRVLFWGIFGAVVFRLAFIFAGVALLDALSWIVYVFGAFLLYTAYTLFTSDHVEVDPEHNPVLVRLRQRLPQTDDYCGDKFIVREDGRQMVTPLLTVLISIELTDILFAVDSIPAVLAITTNQFIVFSSNAFAILGLRALYFLLAGHEDRFVYLNNGLGVILGFAGVTFIVEGLGANIPTGISLTFVAVVLAVTLWLSWRHRPDAAEDGAADEQQPAPADADGAAPDDDDPSGDQGTVTAVAVDEGSEHETRNSDRT